MPKIPVTETSVGFQPATMPTISGDSYAAPGRAMQGLGRALGDLGEAFAATVGAQDEFNDNLKLHEFDNRESELQIRSQHEFTRENPRGWSIEQHGARKQRYDALYNSLTSPKSKQKAQTYWATRGHNFYENDTRFEYGRIDNKLYDDTSARITGIMSRSALDNADTIGEQVQRALAESDLIISKIPGASEGRKRQLESEAAQMAINKMREVYTKAGRLDEFYPAIEGLVRQRQMMEQNAPAGAGQPAPQRGAASIEPATGGHAIVTAGGGARFRVSAAYADRFAGLVRDLEAEGVTINGGESGGYANRNIANTNTKSRHAFGEAVDINWNQNPRGGLGQISKQVSPDRIREIARANGLKWGGVWKNPDPMHFEVDRDADFKPQPTAVAAPGPGLTPKVTAYSPQAAGSSLVNMEGTYAASRPGPDGKAIVRTLEDVQAGRSEYITVAGDPSQYGKTYVIPEIIYIDRAGREQTLRNVKAVVHDTGSAFKGAGDQKFDIPVARDLSNDQMNKQPFLKAGVQFVPEGGGSGGRVQVADASGRPVGVIPQSARKEFVEHFNKHSQQYAREHEALQEKWAHAVAGRIKTIQDNADKGVVRDGDADEIEKLIATKPELAARFGLAGGAAELRQYVDEMAILRLYPPSYQAEVLRRIDDNIRMAPANVPPEAIAAAIKRKERIEKLYGHTVEALGKDQLAWANQVGVVRIGRLDLADPESVRRRIADAKTVAEHFGSPGIPRDIVFLTAQEKDELANVMRVGGKPMLHRLGLIYAGFGDEYGLKVIAEFAKQAPEAAMAGMMLAKGYEQKTIEDLATGIERQQKRALGEKQTAPPKPVDALKAYAEVFGNALSRTGERNGDANVAMVMEAANAIYEARAVRSNWTDAKPDEYKKILKELSGHSLDKQGNSFGGIVFQSGVFSNANPVILPNNLRSDALKTVLDTLYSVDEMAAVDNRPMVAPGGTGSKEAVMRGGIRSPQMQDPHPKDVAVSRHLFDAFGRGPTSENGTPLSISTLRRGTLVTIGDGRYWIAMGDPASDDPQFVRDGSYGQGGKGRNFVLDLRALEPIIKSRRPDLYKGYVDPTWAKPPPGQPVPQMAPADKPHPYYTPPAVNPYQKSEPQKLAPGFDPQSMGHISDVMRGVDAARPEGFKVGPEISPNIEDRRPKGAKPAPATRAPNSIPKAGQ